MNHVWHEYLIEANDHENKEEMKCGVSGRLTVYTKSGVELVGNFVHRIRAKRHCTHMKLLHFHLYRNRL